MVQLHRLEGFYRVAVSGGYTRAAREFPYPISQPAVHQQVRKLEVELGVRLFERVARDQMRLTSGGQKLFDFCAPFFRDLPNVCRSLAAKDFGGTLRIDAAALEIRHILPAWLKRLQRARPDIRVVLQEIDVPDAGRVLSGSADLIVDFEASVPHGLASRRVGTHFAFVVCPASYASARHKPPTFAELAQHPFVSYHPRLPHFEHQMRAFDRLGQRPETMLSAASTEAILGFVQAELGYSLIPWPKPTGPRVRGVLALRQSGPGTEFQILAMYKERAEQDPLVSAALAALD